MPAAERRPEEENNTFSDVNKEEDLLLLQPTHHHHNHREKTTGGTAENGGGEEADDGNNKEESGGGGGDDDVAEIIDVVDDDEQEKKNTTCDSKEENGGQLSNGEEDENDEKEEFILVRPSEIRKEVQCPICLGIIRKTRTVMECLHRFCRECIDKSMRLGNNECPACRTHCPSRRSLRDDPNFDALIAAIYPDIDKYEEEEMSFQDDDKARNKQIQDAIAQTYHRQTEALGKKRKRSQPTYRRRRNYRSEDEEEANDHDGGRDSSSEDERCTEIKTRRSKRWRGQPSPAGASGDGGGNEHDQEVRKESVVSPAGLVGTSELLAWGGGGIRSNTRHGSGAGGYGKHSRSRLAKLANHLRNLKDNESEQPITVELISLDQQKLYGLQNNFLSCKPHLSVWQICQFIATQTSLPPEGVEILAAKDPSSQLSSCSPIQGQLASSCALEACKDDLQVLDSKETLDGLRTAYSSFYQGKLLLAYQKKAST